MKNIIFVASLLRIAAIFLVMEGIVQAATTKSSGGTQTAKATFAGGCFWCMEPPYDELDGVIATISGYIGGTKKNPTYEEVSAGSTGHAEAVQVTYDPKKSVTKNCSMFSGATSIRSQPMLNSVTPAASIARRSFTMMRLRKRSRKSPKKLSNLTLNSPS